jgi:hypothetical protein
MEGKLHPLAGHPVRVADGLWTLPGERAQAVLSPRAASVCLWSDVDLRVYAWPSLAPRRATSTPVAGRLRSLCWADEQTLLGVVDGVHGVTVVRWDADGGERLDAATLPPLAAAPHGLQVAPSGDWIVVAADVVCTGNARAMDDVSSWPVSLRHTLDDEEAVSARASTDLTAWLSPDGDRAFVHDDGWPGVLDLRRGAIARCRDEYDWFRGRLERVRWLRHTELLCEWTHGGRRRMRFYDLDPPGTSAEFEPNLAVAGRELADTFLCDPAGEHVLAAWIRPTGPQRWLRGNLWRVDVDEGVWTTRGTATPTPGAGRIVDAAWCEGRVLLAELRGRGGQGACHLTLDAGGPDARPLVPSTAMAYDDLRVDAVGRSAVVRATNLRRGGVGSAVKTWLVEVDVALANAPGEQVPERDGEFSVRGRAPGG